MEKTHDIVSLFLCAPRLQGARGVWLRVLTHPFLSAAFGFLLMLDQGFFPAAVAAGLAAMVAVWGWGSHQSPQLKPQPVDL